MNVFVEMALGWLVLGSLVAVAVLAEHFRAAARFPRKAGWWLIAAIIVWWPWPVWVWCATQTETETPRTAPIALTTFVFVGALGLGWGGGLKLYDSLYPKELEPADTPALSAMVEGIMRNPGTKDEQTQIGIPDCLFSDRVLDVSDRRLHLRI